MSNEIIHESVITCPECGVQTKETMPDDSCQYFYQCPSCKALLKPKKQDLKKGMG